MRRVLVLFFIFLLSFSTFVFPQMTQMSKEYLMMQSLKNPSLAPLDYKLGPGDRVLINLWGNKNAIYKLSVSRDGSVFLPKYTKSMSSQFPMSGYSNIQTLDVVPALGEIKAEGLTVDDLKTEVERRISKYFHGVNARVTLYSLREFTVSIVGNITKPGVYSVTPLYRLSNLIEIAGGIKGNGSRRNISIKNRNGITHTYDLYEFYYKGNPEQNPHIKPGDIITIPQAVMSVKILGRVLKTGNYEIKKGERLKDLIEMAGGLQKRGSLTRKIKIYNINDPKILTEIDPYKLLVENDSLSNIELQTGDVVTIPSEPFTVTVVGQVTQGGTFEYEPGADFNYYLGLAGGFGERANEGNIRITRWNGTRIKWKRGVEIKPGDTIVVGRAELKGWKDYLEVTLNAANLLFIIWTVSR